MIALGDIISRTNKNKIQFKFTIKIVQISIFWIIIKGYGFQNSDATIIYQKNKLGFIIGDQWNTCTLPLIQTSFAYFDVKIQ